MEANKISPHHTWMLLDGGDLECSVCGCKWPFYENRPDVVCERTDEQISTEDVAAKVDQQPLNGIRRKKPLGEEM